MIRILFDNKILPALGILYLKETFVLILINIIFSFLHSNVDNDFSLIDLMSIDGRLFYMFYTDSILK